MSYCYIICYKNITRPKLTSLSIVCLLLLHDYFQIDSCIITKIYRQLVGLLGQFKIVIERIRNVCSHFIKYYRVIFILFSLTVKNVTKCKKKPTLFVDNSKPYNASFYNVQTILLFFPLLTYYQKFYLFIETLKFE